MTETENINLLIADGSKIAALRKQNHLTRKDVGHKTHVSASCVKLWEEGKTKARGIRVLKLAEAFNCGIDDLLAQPRTERTAPEPEAPLADSVLNHTPYPSAQGPAPIGGEIPLAEPKPCNIDRILDRIMVDPTAFLNGDADDDGEDEGEDETSASLPDPEVTMQLIGGAPGEPAHVVASIKKPLSELFNTETVIEIPTQVTGDTNPLLVALEQNAPPSTILRVIGMLAGRLATQIEALEQQLTSERERFVTTTQSLVDLLTDEIASYQKKDGP